MADDEQRRLQHEGAGDADALALTARELDRPTTAGVTGVDADGLEDLAGPRPTLVTGPDAPDGQRLHDRVEDAATGIERRDGVLEDHLYFRARLS